MSSRSRRRTYTSAKAKGCECKNQPPGSSGSRDNEIHETGCPLRRRPTALVRSVENDNTVVFTDDALVAADVALDLNRSVIQVPSCALVVPDSQSIPLFCLLWAELRVVARGDRYVTFCEVSDENTEKLWSSMGLES